MKEDLAGNKFVSDKTTNTTACCCFGPQIIDGVRQPMCPCSMAEYYYGLQRMVEILGVDESGVVTGKALSIEGE